MIGANGTGKTTWARKHRDQLPHHFYDADAIARGLGDANDPGRQTEARAIVDLQIAQRLRNRETFGFESTWSGESRPAVVRRAKDLDYETHAVFVGTNEVEINVERVRQRVLEGGHNVPGTEIERRWHAAQENLRASSHVPPWAERLARRAGTPEER